MAILITKQEQQTDWGALAAGIEEGKIKLNLGDEVKFELKTGEKITAQVVRTAGNGKRTAFVSKECLSEEMPMNKKRTNDCGWKNSDLREKLNTEIFALLPDDLAAVIKPALRRQYVKEYEEVVECEDKLWLPSEYEIHGREIFARHIEGEEQFPFFEDRRNRMKKIGEEGTDTDWFWCESPHASNTTAFCYVSYGGHPSSSVASTPLGVPLCFEI